MRFYTQPLLTGIATSVTYVYICEYRNNPTGNAFVFVCDLFVPMIQTVYSDY